jgi:hypothetical protein
MFPSDGIQQSTIHVSRPYSSTSVGKITDSAQPICCFERYQSKLLRFITNAPWYITNQTLQQDLRIPPVRTVFRERSAAHHKMLSSHPNPLMDPLLAKQQALEKKMVPAWDTLRMCRWTPPSPPSISVSSLAHRKQCT